MNQDKIEEVRKGMYFSDRCQFCHEFGEKAESYLCERCRDKIFGWLNSKGWTILQTESQLFEPKPEGSPMFLDTNGQWKLKPDRAELREEIAQELYYFRGLDEGNFSRVIWGNAYPPIKEVCRKRADQILALIPDYEQKSPMYLDSKGQWQVRLDRPELREKRGQAIYEVSSNERDQFIDEYKLDIRKARNWDELDDRAKSYWCLKADQILFIPDELPKDKPPLLSDEKLDALWRCEKGLGREAVWAVPKRFAQQAQREADIKFYGGEK